MKKTQNNYTIEVRGSKLLCLALVCSGKLSPFMCDVHQNRTREVVKSEVTVCLKFLFLL